MKMVDVTVTDTDEKDYKEIAHFGYELEDEICLADWVALAESAKAWILSKLAEE
jgi:hypothetical protein